MDEQPATRVAARVLPVVTWFLVGLFAIWAAGRVFGLDRSSPWAQLMAFTPYVAAVSVIPLTLALFTRQWWQAGVAALVCVTLGVCVLPRSFGGASTTQGSPLTVMSANLYEGGADPTTIVNLVRDHGVDVLTLQEFTPQADADLTAAGLTGLLPYSQRHPIPYTQGSAVFSRFPLTDGGAKTNEGGFLQAHAVVRTPEGKAVAVESVHPLAPAEASSVSLWSQDLRDQTPAGAGGPPRILAGDFNATLDHSQLRRILDTGYRDAAAEVGAGLTPTWPFSGRRAIVTPKVTLDHVLVDAGIAVRDFDAFTVPRSDHRAVIAALTLP